jgi:hypothetical protein
MYLLWRNCLYLLFIVGQIYRTLREHMICSPPHISPRLLALSSLYRCKNWGFQKINPSRAPWGTRIWKWSWLKSLPVFIPLHLLLTLWEAPASQLSLVSSVSKFKKYTSFYHNSKADSWYISPRRRMWGNWKGLWRHPWLLRTCTKDEWVRITCSCVQIWLKTPRDQVLRCSKTV